MSDDGNLPAEISTNEVSRTDEVALAREFVEVEKAKVSVELKAIEASDEQDKRMAAFHTQRISLQDEADQRRVELVRQMNAGRLRLCCPANDAGPLHGVLGWRVPKGNRHRRFDSCGRRHRGLRDNLRWNEGRPVAS